jgi:hypothetical protein
MTSDKEILAQWMIRHEYATGHGETIEGLLDELKWQIKEQWERAAAAEREACAMVCEAVADEEVGMAYAGMALCCADNIRARGQTKPEPETLSPAEHRRRTNAPWNDKASY